MSFDSDVIKPGRGRVIRVDVSDDDFATVRYRWGDKAGLLDGTNQYSNRLLELGQVRRGLGQNRIAASTTTSLRLDNADGALDEICGNSGLDLASGLRFRVYVVLYEAGAAFSPVPKMLGEFSLSSWPEQDNTTVELQLADDFMGRLGPGLQLPHFLDWQAVGTSSNNPIINGIGLPTTLDVRTPIQLAFGEDWLLTHPHVIPVGNNGENETYGPINVPGTIDFGASKVILPLYCTTDLSAVSQNLVQQLRVERISKPPTLDAQDGVPELREIPRTAWHYTRQTEVVVWSVEKSPTITKAGKDYQIVYLVVRTDLGDTAIFDTASGGSSTTTLNNDDFLARRAQLMNYKDSGSYDPAAVDSAGDRYWACIARVINWYAKVLPASQITNAPTVLPGSHAVDVMTDLVSVYSDATVDTTSAARVKAGTISARCFGVVQAWSERANNANIYQPPLSLRQVLTNLAQSSDIDIFVNWSGQIAFAADVYDYVTATQFPTLITFREEEISNVRRWVPSAGERNAAFNRIYFEGARPNPADSVFFRGGERDNSIPFQGPWDLENATIPVTKRIIEIGLQQGWRPARQQREDPIRWRNIDPVSRDYISFRTHIGGLRLELGDYFKVVWTRGADIGGPYQSTVFQLESLTYAPADDTIEMEAVWRDDTVTERQYLLDDETLLVRSKGALSGNATGDENGLVEFDGTINLTTMGVEPGDILVYRLSSEAADSFLYNCAFRIAVVRTADVDVEPWNGSTFPGLTPVPNAEWYIVRGATTYPDAISDPTNYPDGGTMYGKVTDAAGDYSNAEQGNRLING